MENLWFYIKLGLNHVLDLAAYDHILFLAALAIPFTFKNWKKVVLLATVFTIAHCLSLVLSTYEVLTMDVGIIEFLIPITILLTAMLNLVFVFFGAIRTNDVSGVFGTILHVVFTAFFGFIHGFGFSNYFKMLVAGEEEKLVPLIGFASGIEISQVMVVLIILTLTYLFQSILKVKKSSFVVIASILVVFITIPMLIATFPW